MLEALISSKTRIKLLLKFFLNSKNRSYLRSLESEFGESSNAIRVELNRLENAGLLTTHMDGNKKIFQANTQHPLYHEIHRLLLKNYGIERIIEDVIKRLGEVERVFLTGSFSQGKDSPVIDLLLIGHVDQNYLVRLIERAEAIVERKIRYLIYSPQEFQELDWSAFQPEPVLLWAR